MFGFILVFRKNSVSVISLVLGGRFGVGEKMSKVQVVVVRVLGR